MTKFCRDCRWREQSSLDSGRHSNCLSPKSKRLPTDLVTGEKGARKVRLCLSQRAADPIIAFLFDYCGSQGRWWEPKQ